MRKVLLGTAAAATLSVGMLFAGPAGAAALGAGLNPALNEASNVEQAAVVCRRGPTRCNAAGQCWRGPRRCWNTYSGYDPYYYGGPYAYGPGPYWGGPGVGFSIGVGPHWGWRRW